MESQAQLMLILKVVIPIIAGVVSALLAAGFGLAIWLLKRWFERLQAFGDETRALLVSCQREKTNCQKELSQRYATKSEVARSFDHVWNQLNPLKDSVAEMKGRSVNSGGLES